MKPHPKAENTAQRGSGKLHGKIAIITGGDSGIGRAVAVSFAKEGADVCVVYLEEHRDAKEPNNLSNNTVVNVCLSTATLATRNSAPGLLTKQ